MNERKITTENLERGSLHESLSHHMYRAGVSDQGRERINGALTAAMEHVAKQHSLERGVGGHHLDDISHFLDTKYAGRRELKAKERDVLTTALRHHYGISANDNEAPVAQKKAA